MQQNLLKKKLLSGQPAFGVSVMIPSPHVVEMVARLGFDWVLIDCEHGAISRESVELMVMAAEANGITPICRPATNQSQDIQQVLETGAMGVQVPHVSSAQIARSVVEAAKYFPAGRRSLAAGTRPANYGWGLSMSDFVQRANEETLLCVQIEEAEALANLDEIVQIDEIDVIFVGPSDLSQSLKLPGQSDAVQLQQAMDQVFDTATRAGKVAGCAGNISATHRYIGQNVRYLYTHFTTLLSASANDFLASARSDRSQGLSPGD